MKVIVISNGKFNIALANESIEELTKALVFRSVFSIIAIIKNINSML